jgi:hypothetical protein
VFVFREEHATPRNCDGVVASMVSKHHWSVIVCASPWDSLELYKR